ncbi:MAG: 3-phosphoshikimate 1-carboxyvinyltransferase [Rhodopirellula sp.]|nr:3-phosphoshikimate 1-carboxyvinyltransferase [Rhodopirellula sp.]
MDDAYLVKPVTEPVRGAIRPPGSKSLTNRALITAALASGTTQLTGVLASDDTRVMVESLNRLGIPVTHDVENCTMEVIGCSGRPPATKAELWLENSGTSIRFLTAFCALGNGEYRLDGNDRMRERPISHLVESLTKVGVEIECELGSGCPPVRIKAQGLSGGQTTMAGNISSQYLSALLMAAPCASRPVDIDVTGELVSLPYIDMTMGVMAQFGATVSCSEPNRFSISPQQYKATNYAIEPDASAASYFFAAAAITGGEVTVEGLSSYALQGDVNFVDALEQMGCTVEYRDDSITVRGGSLTGVDIDMNAISDTAQTLAVVALFADGPTRIRNVGHMRHKETDRVAAVVNEIHRMGVAAEEHEDGLTITPGTIQPATIQTYDDHRMAMSFALAGLRTEGIRIANPACTGKTYPHFFSDLEKLCGTNS